MTLESAVEILNARDHRDFNGWQIALCRGPGGDRWVEDDAPFRGDRIEFTEFEAIAIAEKYVRDGDGRPADEERRQWSLE